MYVVVFIHFPLNSLLEHLQFIGYIFCIFEAKRTMFLENLYFYVDLMLEICKHKFQWQQLYLEGPAVPAAAFGGQLKNFKCHINMLEV